MLEGKKCSMCGKELIMWDNVRVENKEHQWVDAILYYCCECGQFLIGRPM